MFWLDEFSFIFGFEDVFYDRFRNTFLVIVAIFDFLFRDLSEVLLFC